MKVNKQAKKFANISVAAALICCNGCALAAINILPSKSTAQIDEEMKLPNLIEHLKQLQRFADNNTLIPGTRLLGTPGYTASKHYFVEKLQHAGYQVSLQTVPLTITYMQKPRVFEQISPTKIQFTDDFDYSPVVGGGGGDITGYVQSLGQADGCKPEDFVNFKAGNIALLPIGGCRTQIKIQNAAQANAQAAIIANTAPGIFYIGFVSPGANIPSLIVSSNIAKAFNELISQKNPPKVHIKFDALIMHTESENIIAESKTGNPNHVVMVGAHLDSSAGNAGLNDNGSAAATVLEIALLMKDVKPVNKLRFAFWTAEEVGLLGSTYYVNQLPNSEKNKIAYYLNYEILGAPNGARLIMAPKTGVTPKGSEKISNLYIDYFKDHKLKYLVFDPAKGRAGERSDMYAFMKADIPVGYLVSGADLPWNLALSQIFTDLPNRKLGQSMHPCYHKLCDKLSINDQLKDPNFDFDLYLQMSKAAAFAVYSLAMAPGS